MRKTYNVLETLFKGSLAWKIRHQDTKSLREVDNVEFTPITKHGIWIEDLLALPSI